MWKRIAALVIAASCTPTPLYISHALPSHDGAQWHSCAPGYGNPGPNGNECLEGYACVRGGCEFCGGETFAPSRCSEGLD